MTNASANSPLAKSAAVRVPPQVAHVYTMTRLNMQVEISRPVDRP